MSRGEQNQTNVSNGICDPQGKFRVSWVQHLQSGLPGTPAFGDSTGAMCQCWPQGGLVRWCTPLCPRRGMGASTWVLSEIQRPHPGPGSQGPGPSSRRDAGAGLARGRQGAGVWGQILEDQHRNHTQGSRTQRLAPAQSAPPPLLPARGHSARPSEGAGWSPVPLRATTLPTRPGLPALLTLRGRPGQATGWALGRPGACGREQKLWGQSPETQGGGSQLALPEPGGHSTA